MSAADHPRLTICTVSGIEFSPFDPRPEDVCLSDIAHALARIARFNGHTSEPHCPYSVAQHSCIVAQLVGGGGAPDDVILMALMHDAAEAYIGDMPAPIKRESSCVDYRRAELAIDDVISQAMGYSGMDMDVMRQAVRVIKAADRMALEAERRDLMPACDWWGDGIAPRVPTITPWGWREAKVEFLRRANSLMGVADADQT